jgi:hypothetical protein
MSGIANLVVGVVIHTYRIARPTSGSAALELPTPVEVQQRERLAGQ